MESVRDALSRHDASTGQEVQIACAASDINLLRPTKLAVKADAINWLNWATKRHSQKLQVP